jgi:hypothetical protein
MRAATQTWVYVVELVIGAGCFAAGVGAFHRGLRVVAGALLVAGVAAGVHAVAALAGRI